MKRLLAGTTIFVALFVLIANTASAQRPSVLIGTRKSLNGEHEAVRQDGLSYMATDAVVARMKRNNYLVRIPQKGTGYFLADLGRGYHGNREILKTARPWVLKFLNREAAHFAKNFRGASFKVTSLARSREYQRFLQRRNPNATTRSAHTTGSVLDISKKGMSATQIRWMRTHLATLEKCGWAHATEEFRQSTFHVLVRKRFGQGQCGLAK